MNERSASGGLSFLTDTEGCHGSCSCALWWDVACSAEIFWGSRNTGYKGRPWELYDSEGKQWLMQRHLQGLAVSSFVDLLWGATALDCSGILPSVPRDGLFVLLILSRMARVWKNVKPHLFALYLGIKVIKVKALHEKNRICYWLGWDLGTAKAGSHS